MRFRPSTKLILPAAVGIYLAAVLGYASWDSRPKVKPAAASESPEITAIKRTENLAERAGHYRRLLERVGPEQGQEELYRSGLPFTGEAHLLNHVAGDFLYEKFGNQGLSKCKTYFLESCYHGFLLHVIGNDKTTDGQLEEIMQSCRDAGPTVPTQCSHAIGHGYLASLGYKNLPAALEQCDRLESALTAFPRYNCLDGVFMENIWGVHGGAPSPDRWVKEGDEIYPCGESWLKAHYLEPCWGNQPAWIFQQHKGQFEPVDAACRRLPNDSSHRKSCFNGLARQIHTATGGSNKKAYGLCRVMKDQYETCIHTMMDAGFGVGDRHEIVQICRDIEPGIKESCYVRLYGLIRYYARDDDERREVCGRIEEKEWADRCRQGTL